MIGMIRRNAEWLFVTGFTALIATGCGSNGYSGAEFQSQVPPPAPFVTGTVFLPNGELATSDSWWRWAGRLHLLPPAYAQDCAFSQTVLPVDTAVQVNLELVDYVDAGDGQIDDPTLLANNFVDADTGVYTILSPAVANVNDCGLMVQVGGDISVQTRAFVFQRTTNIDAVSEAVVRVVLERLTRAPAVQLCSFTSAALQRIYSAVQRAACTVSGDSVFTFNQKVYARVATNCCVRNAVNAATGVPADPLCARVNCQ